MEGMVTDVLSTLNLREESYVLYERIMRHIQPYSHEWNAHLPHLAPTNER